MRVLALAAVGILSCRSVGQAQRGSSDPNLEPLDPTGRISYFIADEIPHSGYRPGDDDLATWALQEWERASHGTIHFERTLDEAESLLRLFFLNPGPAKIGTSQRFMSMRRVRAMVTVRANVEVLVEPLGTLVKKDSLLRDTIVYLTCLHEIGHALGLPHSSSQDDVTGEGEVATNPARLSNHRELVSLGHDE